MHLAFRTPASVQFFSSSFVAVWFLSRFFLLFFFRRLLTFFEYLVPKCDYESGAKKIRRQKKMSTKMCKEWKIPNWMRTKMPTNTKKTEDKICKHSLTFPSTSTYNIHTQCTHTHTHTCYFIRHLSEFGTKTRNWSFVLCFSPDSWLFFLFFFFSFSSVVCRAHPKARRFHLWFILVYLLKSMS